MKLLDKEFRSEFDKPDDSPGFLLWQVSNMWQRKQRDALKILDLTHTQFVLLTSLSWLEKSGEPITQVQLAHLTRVDVMMTSQVLRTLEKKALIHRSPHPVDTRANQIHTTWFGQDLVAKALPLVEQVDKEFFARLQNAGAPLISLLQQLLQQ